MTHFTTKSVLRASFALLLLCAGWLLPATVTPANADERCFGAAGQGCGSWNVVEMPKPAFCGHLIYAHMAVCLVSGGSMTHDPCCAKNPNGKQCGGTNARSECTVAWDKSVRRAFWSYQWPRLIDTSVVNNTGDVDRPLYCATKGSRIHKNDTEYCCSRQSREGNFWERIGRPSLHVCK